MKMTRLFATAFVALLLCASHVGAAQPEERFLLTPTLLAKLKTVAPELQKLDKREEEEDDGKDSPTVEDYVRILEKEPGAKAILARHGMSTRQFALLTFAMAHAAVFVGVEPHMDKKQAAEMLATFTKEQRANIALLRKTDMSSYYKGLKR